MKRLISLESCRGLQLPLIAVMLLAVMSLSSCDPDDEYAYNSLIGTWVEVAPGNGTYTFYSDGQGVNSYYDAYGYQWDDWFDWWTDNGTVTLQWDDYPTEYFSWSFSGNSLYLYPYGGGDPIVLQPY